MTIEKHHFSILEGVHDEVFHFVDTAILEWGIERKLNSNLFLYSFDTLSISDARLIRNQAVLKGQDGPQIFVISVFTINQEAAQSLLKIFEEAPPATHFFLILPSIVHLPETLLSRAQIIDTGINEAKKEYVTLAKEIKKASYPKRLELIENFTKDTKIELPLRTHTLYLLEAIEKEFSASKVKIDKDIFLFYKFLGQSTSSPKMILETVAALF